MEFAIALTLVQASAAIGDLRNKNTACGRFLAFFLDKLITRLRAGASVESLELDEEMLAYASADLQGCADEAWIWSGSDMGTSLNQVNGFTSAPQDGAPSGPLSERETQDWGGWEHIQRTLQQLLQDKQGTQALPPPSLPAAQKSPYAQPPSSYPPRPPPQQHTPSNQSLAPHPPASAQPPVSPGGNGGSSRISIQDIM